MRPPRPPAQVAGAVGAVGAAGQGRPVRGSRAGQDQRPVYFVSRFSSAAPMASIMSAEARKPAFQVAT